MDLRLDLEFLVSLDWSHGTPPAFLDAVVDPCARPDLATSIAKLGHSCPGPWMRRERLHFTVDAFVLNTKLRRVHLDRAGSVVEPEPLKEKRERGREITLEAEEPKRVWVVGTRLLAAVTLMPAVQWDFQEVPCRSFLFSF
jgi:hypothetical protein